MVRLLLSAVMFVVALSGCSIPRESIRSDGVVTIDLVGPRMFRIGNHLFFESDLEVAFQISANRSKIERFELRIPSSMLTAKDGRDGCGNLAQVMVAARKPWKAFAWDRNDESTLREIYCDVIVVA